MQSTAKLPVIGMDIAKNIFQLHIVDAESSEIQRVKLKRDRVADFFANRQSSLVALEACGGAHHWARMLQAQGHQAKLLPAKHVRPFVLRDKTDARDAQAIWVAAQALQAIPGIGPLTATALGATAADLSSFDSGRQFAVWLGLTPRQTGTGGIRSALSGGLKYTLVAGDSVTVAAFGLRA